MVVALELNKLSEQSGIQCSIVTTNLPFESMALTQLALNRNQGGFVWQSKWVVGDNCCQGV